MPDGFVNIVVRQKFSDVLHKLQCTKMNFSCYTGHGSELSLNLQVSTGSVLEFSTVETTALFDVFFRGYIAEVED